jgi:hypothetical protein
MCTSGNKRQLLSIEQAHQESVVWDVKLHRQERHIAWVYVHSTWPGTQPGDVVKRSVAKAESHHTVLPISIGTHVLVEGMVEIGPNVLLIALSRRYACRCRFVFTAKVDAPCSDQKYLALMKHIKAAVWMK